MRFPFVIGRDDYTERLLFYFKKIYSEEEIFFPKREALVSFITSKFAAEVLEFLVESDFKGSINAASSKPVSLNTLIRLSEEALGKKALFTDKTGKSPYGVSEDGYMDCTRLNQQGLNGEDIESWLPELLEFYKERLH